MDPSIMKLLEDDEDESMHSGAEVEALSAALNRDIGGDAGALSSSPSEPAAGLLAAGSTSASQQILKDWQNSSQEENNMKIQQEKQNLESVEQQHPSQGDFNPPGAETQDKQVDHQQGQLPLQVEGSHFDQQQQTEKVTLFQVSDKEKAGNPGDPVQGVNTSKQEVVQQSVQLNNQQAPTGGEVNMASRKTKPAPSIPFHMLIPILKPHLDKDRSMQLQAVFTKLRNNEVSKEDFLRVIRNIVGDQMLRQAAHKVQMQLHAQTTRSAQTNPSQYPPQGQASSSQQLPTNGSPQLTESQFFLPLNSPSSQKGSNQLYNPDSIVQMGATASSSSLEDTGQSSQGTENKVDAKGVHPQNYPSNVSPQGINKQQQVVQLPQPSFSMYGSTTNFNAHAYPRRSITSGTTLRPLNQASPQMRPFQSLNVMNMPKHDVQNTSETKRLYTGPVSSHSTSQNTVPGQMSTTKEQKSSAFPSMSYVKQEAVDQITEPSNRSQTAARDDSSFSSMHLNQGNSALGIVKNDIAEKQPSMAGQLDQSVQVSSMAPLHAVVAAKTPAKKPSVGQKKPLEAPGSSPPVSSKKQKTSGTFLDQSIEQLNDVTAVSGVNLREEEEQLLSAPKEESKASEATRRVVQEEEEKLLLEKGPLQKKLEQIMLKCGMSSISSDAMRCLSLVKSSYSTMANIPQCVEERLRGLVTHLVRLSKQRVNIERTKHRFAVTSDVRRQILEVNKKAREEWDKKQAVEAEKLRKPNEDREDFLAKFTKCEGRKTEGSTSVEADRDKEEGRPKNLKANKEEDDKMRATAANVAARAAFGGDDMLSKWQLMAEQARQKREGIDGASGSQPGKSPSGKAITFGRSSREHQESEKKSHSATSVSGGGRKFGRSGITAHPKVARAISLKDVIAVLEREPQMSKSTLLYRLYDKLPGDSSAE